MTHEPIVVERIFNAPINAVWNAITDPVKMKEWYFDLPGFRPEVGFTFEFYAGDENRKFLHRCKVTASVPGKKLAYSWQYENDPGYSVVTFELFEEGTQTRLKLTHEGVESFSKEDPAFDRKNFVAGWTDFIGINLKNFVEATGRIKD